MPEFTITPLTIPASVSAPDAADFLEYTALDNLVYAAALGFDDFLHEAEEELPDWRIPGRFCEGHIAKSGGRIVGAALYAGQNDSSETSAYIIVAPELRRRGIGSALFDRIAERAREDGRLVLQGHLFDSVHKDGVYEDDASNDGASNDGASVRSAPRVPAESGVGSIDAANPGLAFVLAKGGVLEQVGRVSRLPLPLDSDAVGELESVARRGYEGEYDLVRWEGLTPEQYLDDIAVLITRMSTDTPAAGLERTEDVWDADRTREFERLLETSPRRRFVVAARHLATGRLVGYTQLNAPAEAPRAVDQWATLVLSEHRGHRLGLALKLENLRYLEELAPGHPSVITINAAENSPMLSVNEAVGFVAVGHEGNVQLTLGA